jgi:hypothetical protein
MKMKYEYAILIWATPYGKEKKVVKEFPYYDEEPTDDEILDRVNHVVEAHEGKNDDVDSASEIYATVEKRYKRAY